VCMRVRVYDAFVCVCARVCVCECFLSACVFEIIFLLTLTV